MEAPCRQGRELPEQGRILAASAQGTESRQASAYKLNRRKPSPDDRHLKAAVWCPAKSKGLEHTFCHTSHVILVTSAPGALIPQPWNGDIGPSSQRHSDLMTRYIPSTPHRRDTEHSSLPLLLSLTTTSERVTYTSPLCSQPQQVLGFRLHATHQPTPFPPLMRQDLNKPALPASKGYLQPSKLLTHPLNSGLTTTSSEKRLSTFQIKWVTLCWVPSHSGLVHKKQSIVISEVFSSARQYLHGHTRRCSTGTQIFY